MKLLWVKQLMNRRINEQTTTTGQAVGSLIRNASEMRKQLQQGSICANDDDDEVKVPMKPTGGYTLKQSASTGEYWIMQGDKGTKVPEEFLSIASDKSMKGSQRASIIVKKMEEKDKKFQEDHKEKK